MSIGSSASNGRGDAVTVSFAERYAASSQFDAIYKEGMGLVERTAAYLDGAGRREAKSLKGPLTLAYATESMRLTTRLLELASWLLMRRSLRDGEISLEQADAKRRRIKLAAIGRPSHSQSFESLPDGFRALVAASVALNDRIVQLDKALERAEPAATTAAPEAANPVNSQLARLAAAFPLAARN